MNFAGFCRLNASKFPDREFLIESYPSTKTRRALTWKKLEEDTNKVANYLIDECGVKKGDVVQHLMLNSIEWYITYMAVLKAGAVISPLNFRFASGDIKYACDVTKSKVFILGDGFVARVEPIRQEMDLLQPLHLRGGQGPGRYEVLQRHHGKGKDRPVLVDMADDDMAELMFTSGTTGAPKPVSHTHGTLFWIGIGNALTYNLGHMSVYLSPHPFYHSGTLFLSFPCFIAAGKILMPMELQPENYLQVTSGRGVHGRLEHRPDVGRHPGGHQVR